MHHLTRKYGIEVHKIEGVGRRPTSGDSLQKCQIDNSSDGRISSILIGNTIYLDNHGIH